MHLISVIFLAAWALLAAGAPAHAGFVASAIGAIGTFLASGSALAQLALGALFTAAKIGIGLLTKAKETQTTAGVDAQVSVGGDNPLSFIMGNFATAGQREYINTWGKNNKTPNAYLVQVFSISDLPLGALTGLWCGDTKCTVPDFSQPATDERGWSVEEFKIGDDDNLWINFYDGTQAAADPYLLDKFGADPDRPWTADMIGRGVAYVIVTAEAGSEKFSGIPTCIFETNGIRLYDPTQDTSVGGNGAQRYADPATWAPSSNPAVQIYNILRGIRYEGEWLWGGQTIGAYQFPLANWMTAINACNAPVALAGGGTEPAYRSGAEITVDQQPADVIDDLLAGCSGRIAEVGGIYKVLIGAPGAAVYSFTDDSIVVTEGQSFDPFPGLEEIYNGAQASYPEPAEKWQSKDAPGYFRADLEALDDDRRLVEGLQYPYSPYAVQVQRLLQAAVQDARRFRQHQFTLPPEAWLLEPNDVVAYSSGRNGYADKKFIIVEISGGSNFLQVVTLKEIEPGDYGWNPSTDQKPVAVGFLAPIRPGIQTLVGWQVLPATLYDADGKARRPSIAVLYAGGLIDVDSIRVQVRLKASQAVVFDATVPYDAPEDLQYSTVLNGVFLPATDYEASGIYLSRSNRPFEWSAWLPVTTPNILLGPEDIYLPGLVDEINQSVSDLTDWAVYNTRETIEEAWDNVNLTVDQDAGGFRDKQELRQTLTSGIAGVTAAYQLAISVATGPDSALALRIEDLEVEVNGNLASAVDLLQTQVSEIDGEVTANADAITSLTTTVGNATASGLFRVYTTAASGGASAQIALSVSASAGGNPATAALFLRAMSDGTSQVLVSAGRFAITDGSGNDRYPFVFQDGVLTLTGLRVDGANIVNLQVDWADITNINIDSATIGNATILESNISFGALTDQGGGGFSGAWTTNNQNNAFQVDGWYTICTATVAQSIAGGLVSVSGSWNFNSSTDKNWRVWRSDGVVVDSYSRSGSNHDVSRFAIDNNPTTTPGLTYHFQSYGGGGTGGTVGLKALYRKR